MIRESFKVHSLAAMKKRPTTHKPEAFGPLEHIKVHHLVWEKVIEITKGDFSRVKIISETEVLIK